MVKRYTETQRWLICLAYAVLLTYVILTAYHMLTWPTSQDQGSHVTNPGGHAERDAPNPPTPSNTNNIYISKKVIGCE